jgi:hypothetical protein
MYTPIGITGNKSNSFQQDRSTFGIITIDYSHHEIHEGSYFHCQHVGTGKNAGQTINIYLKTPNSTAFCHAFAKYSANGAAYLKIYESPTITANTGTNGQPAINHNRVLRTASTILDNATVPATGMYGVDVTKTVDGTIIWNEYTGAAKQTGAGGRNEEEHILKANTVYLFEVMSDASGLVLNLIILFYEHTDKA